MIIEPTLALIRAQLGFRIQVRAECGKNVQDRIIWPLGKREIHKTKRGGVFFYSPFNETELGYDLIVISLVVLKIFNLGCDIFYFRKYNIRIKILCCEMSSTNQVYFKSCSCIKFKVEEFLEHNIFWSKYVQ